MEYDIIKQTMQKGGMAVSILESILYGLISGLTEFLPVSSRAHQALMRYLFGVSAEAPVQELLIHIGVFCAILVACREVLSRLMREQKRSSGRRYRRARSLDSKSNYDLRLLKTATLPLLAGLLILLATGKLGQNLLLLMAFWLLNGFILLLADHTSRGNRDSRTMTALDGIVMGIAGALSVLPGVSRTGMIAAYSTARGAESQHTVNWAVLLGLPAMLFVCCLNLFSMFSVGTGVTDFLDFIKFVLSGAAAFGGGYLGISVLKLILSQSGFSKFAYYSIGAAMLSFILYLIT